MKKVLLSLVAIAALVGGAVNAEALSVGDSDYIGSVDPGAPASASDEADYINVLIDIAAGGTFSEDTSPPAGETREYDRTNSTLDCTGCPDATTVGADSNNAPSGSVDVTGFTYLLAKYGNVSHVWYVAGQGLVTVPLDATGGGQSHYSLYNPGTTTVPEGGSTLMLLGAGLAAVGALRRRFNV